MSETENESDPFDLTPVWHTFWEKLTLTDADAALLRKKRGFSDYTIIAGGFRSSQLSNRAIIESMIPMFPDGEELLALAGILLKTDQGYAPNDMFCGLGATGEKDKKTKKPIRKMGLNPILIPYFNESGQVTSIRPHKDNPPRPGAIDKFDETYSGINPYCPFLLRTVGKSLRDTFGEDFPGGELPFCVITEGEFKGKALWQCGIPSIAFPGIQSIKNYGFRKKVTALLEKFGIKKAIVVFDNECKDDPKFTKKFKPDPWDRYESIVWARYTSSTLHRDGIERTEIGWLPNEWRIDGKADWDGALARFVEEAGGDVLAGTKKARTAFLKVLGAAGSDRGFLELFPSEGQRIVEAKLSRLFHRPQCLFGDDKMRDLAKNIKSFDPMLSSAMMECIGRYYTRTPISKEKTLERLIDAKAKALEDKQFLLARSIQERIDGVPKPISNFKLTCDFKLKSSTQHTEYLVRVSNIHKEKTEHHVRIGSGKLSRLAEFRDWCLTFGCTWAGGEKDLQDLTSDMQAASAFREIHEIDHYGWSEDCKLWKFGDRAYLPEGGIPILPDKNMVFWHNGIGYQTDFDPKNLGDGKQQGAPILGELNIEDAAESFILLSQNLFEALGDYDGWLALGTILGYAAHPEILKAYKGAPGLWITGRRGGGKSTVSEWLLQVWGFLPSDGSIPEGCGISTPKPLSLAGTTTGNAVVREFSKYGCIPAWGDEFDRTVTRPEVQDVIKNSYDRKASVKAAYDNTNRTRGVQPKTTPLISGETGTGDSATRSRFVQITMLDEKAKGNAGARLKEMNANCHKFANLGHFLIANRAEFVASTIKKLDEWVSSPKTAEFINKPRARFVSGTPFAAWLTVAEMLETQCSDAHKATLFELIEQRHNFEAFALEHGAENLKDILETSHINNFWQDIFSALQLEQIKASFFQLKYAQIDSDQRVVKYWDRPDISGTQKPVLYLAYEPVYMAYEQEVRKGGRVAKLSLSDLKNEIKRERYWIRPQEGQTSHRLTVDSRRLICWCLDLELHPLGDDIHDFLKALKNPGNSQTDTRVDTGML